MAEQSRHDKGSHTLVAALPPRLLYPASCAPPPASVERPDLYIRDEILVISCPDLYKRRYELPRCQSSGLLGARMQD